MQSRIVVITLCLVVSITGALACGGGNKESGTPEDSAEPTDRVGQAQSTPTTTAPTSTAGAVFDQAGLVREWDPNSQPDPVRLFATGFKASDKEIDLTFKLKEGNRGEVTSAWKYKGQWVVLPGSLKMQAEAGKWTSFTFTPPEGGFDAGDYEVILAKPGTAEIRTLKFTITPSTSNGKLDQTGLTKTWNQATAADPRTFASTFAANDQRIHAVFRLAEGTSGQVQAIWKYGGEVLEFGEQPKIEVSSGKWGAQYLAAGIFPAGEYESIISIVGTAETKSLKFTVGPAGTVGSKPKFEQAGILTSVSQSQTPDPTTFKTAFKTSDRTLYLVFKLSSGSDAAVWVTTIWKYQGQVIYQASTSGPVRSGGWDKAALTVNSGLPPGEYEVALKVTGTSESKSVKFTVN